MPGGANEASGGSLKIPKFIYAKNGKSAVKVTRDGNGLYLSPWKCSNVINGDGVFIKPYGGSGYIDGSGLISGTPQGQGLPDKVPLLGMLLGWLV